MESYTTLSENDVAIAEVCLTRMRNLLPCIERGLGMAVDDVIQELCIVIWETKNNPNYTGKAAYLFEATNNKLLSLRRQATAAKRSGSYEVYSVDFELGDESSLPRQVSPPLSSHRADDLVYMKEALQKLRTAQNKKLTDLLGVLTGEVAGHVQHRLLPHLRKHAASVIYET